MLGEIIIYLVIPLPGLYNVTFQEGNNAYTVDADALFHYNDVLLCIKI